MDLALWNVLHDGRVIAVEGAIPGDLRLSVQIPYLCGHLPTRATYVTIALSGCKLFEYMPYEYPLVAEPDAIATRGLELLSAWLAADGCVRVECADGGAGGQLYLRYTSAQAITAEGRLISQMELESAAERYWSQWQQERA